MTDNSELVKGLRLAGDIERREWGGENAQTLYDRAADEIERLQDLVAKFDQMMDLIIDNIPPKDQAK
jgi:hypothetical protein